MAINRLPVNTGIPFTNACVAYSKYSREELKDIIIG